MAHIYMGGTAGTKMDDRCVSADPRMVFPILSLGLDNGLGTIDIPIHLGIC